MTKLILASGSPRRQELLGLLGINFTSIPADVDESVIKGEHPSDYVHRLAIEKAEAVSEQILDKMDSSETLYTIGGDVTVDIDGDALGKPKNEHDAIEMLTRISGTNHQIRNGIAILQNKEIVFSAIEVTQVHFRDLSKSDIENYVFNTDEWRDKAGSYAAQGEAGKFISKIEGSYYNLLGFPVYTVAAILRAYGFEIKNNTLADAYKKEQIELKKFRA